MYNVASMPLRQARSFLVPRTYLFGSGSSLEYLSDLSDNRVFLVTDIPAMKKAGHYSAVMEILEGTPGHTVETLSIESEPAFSTVAAAVNRVRDFTPGAFIALGGGSVLDTAKALWRLTLDREQTLSDFLARGPRLMDETLCTLTAIPTTSGTGSEVTSAAVYKDDTTGGKNLVLSPLLVPSAAILDPDLTLSMPLSVASVSGFDAFVHAVESYICTVATPFSRACASEAAAGILKHLRASCTSPENGKARAEVHYAASLAGLAISNSCTDLTHSLDQIGARFHVPHGKTLSPLFLPTLEVTKDRAPEGLIALATLCGFGSDSMKSPELFLDHLRQFQIDLGLPLRFRDLGIDKDEYDRCAGEIIPAVAGAFATRVSPASVSEEDLAMILEKAF